MSSNQDIADELLRHKVYLLGYSKQLAGEVVLYLKQTEPEVRELILKLFGVSSRRTITRLRDAESQLRQIRSRAWKRALEYITIQLLDMAEREHDWYRKALPIKTDKADEKRFPSLIASALLAGATLKEIFASLERADGDRAVAQLRIAYLSKDETVLKAVRRLTGPTSYVAASSKNAIGTVAATAVLVSSDVIHKAVTAANRGAFDTEIWISILDGATTQGCRNLHLQKFSVGEGPEPGYHWHCRSERVPYLDGGGTVQASTYAKWADSQPEEFLAYAGKDFSFSKLRPMKLTQVYRTGAP